MASTDTMAISVFLVLGVLLYEAHSFQISQQQQDSEFPHLHFSKRLKKGTITSEICVGRKCASPPQQNKCNAEFFVSSVVLSLIGLAIHLTVKHERGRASEGFMRTAQGRNQAASRAFRRTAHSTSIACSSLSPSPVPRANGPRTSKNRPARRQNRSEIPWDRMAKSSDFEICLSLHPSPLPSQCNRSYTSSCSSSTGGLYPCAPPRRWRGNSKLNLATSPEVVPNEVDLYYHL